MTSNQHSQLERLVATCARRAWVVGYGLLRDTDEAFDAVQQAFVVALRKPDRIPAGDPWPWFGVVVAHEARNLRRKKRPTTNQELGGVMRESDPDPERAAEGTEERLRLRTAVDRLPLAEREAVTLVHLAGMTHKAAGEALGKPRQTVSVHVKSGLRRIGRELDQKPRVVAMRLSAAPVFAVPLNWETMVASWTSAGSAVVPAAGSAGSLAATTLGGIAMSTKLIWVISVSAALGLGALGGRALSQITEGDAATWESDADGRTSMRAGSAPTLWAGNDSPASQPALDATVRDLRRRLDDAVTRNRHLESRLAQADPKVGSTSGPIFTFGRAGKLPAVRDANWTEMAQASSIVGSALREISQCTARGEQAPKSVYLRLQEMVETMRKYEYRTIGKIKTEARHNGEFTHPVTIANLLGAVLVEAGAPLTQAQIRTI
ncbi:MAG: sigma-70 family RNA polymerase sigma factor, partial [bacterium]|nr:sigma-70 family RNA polymerase sigma factor [bacterium]